MLNIELSVGPSDNGRPRPSKHLLDDQISVLLRDVARRTEAEKRVRRIEASAVRPHSVRQSENPAIVAAAVVSVALFLGLCGWNALSAIRLQRGSPQDLTAHEELQEIAALQALAIASAVDDSGEVPLELETVLGLEEGLFTYTPAEGGRFRLRVSEGDLSVSVDSEALGGRSYSRSNHE